MKFLLLAVTAVFSCGADAASTASGRNWRLTIYSLECEGAVLALGARIRYLGPKGPVESPVIRLLDAKGARHLPRSLVWKQPGSRPIADWLSGGGVTNLQSEDVGEVQLKFEPHEAAGEIRLEFGDIDAFPLTRKGTKTVCAGLLNPADLQTPRFIRSGKEGKTDLRFYRTAYPCLSPSKAPVTIEAQYPPYLPRQLLVLGRGYLPNAREIALPMGSARAQSYAFSGADDLKGVEGAARRIVAADFPQLAKAGGFAFDWGLQKGASGNEVYSIGLYELRACPAQ
jgi:hypothetical protein